MKHGTFVRVVMVVLLAVLIVGLPTRVHADAVWLVLRDTIGGSVAGLLVGGAIALAVEEGWEPVRVGFIAGTFAGLGLGIYQAVQESKPEQKSLLSIEPGKPVSMRLAFPEVALRSVDATGDGRTELAYRLRVIGASF